MAIPYFKITFSTDNGFYIAGNPMKIGLWPNTNKWARYRIYVGVTYDTLIYEGIIYSPSNWATVDISSVFSEYKNTAGVIMAKIVLVNDANEEYGQVQYTPDFEPIITVFGGAASKILLRKEVHNGIDIFDSKIKNMFSNFFLTTRTSGNVIMIPETELSSLYFYGKGFKFQVKNGTNLIADYDYSGASSETLNYLPIQDFRSALVSTSNKWVNQFDIVTIAGISSSIVVTEAPPTDYKIKFLNSWGVYELIAIQSKADYVPIISEPDISQKYDSVILGLTKHNARKEVRHTYEFTTAYKTQDQRMHLLDMLLSDKTYLLHNEDSYEVLISASNEALANSNGRPVNVTLKIELIDADSAYSPI